MNPSESNMIQLVDNWFSVSNLANLVVTGEHTKSNRKSPCYSWENPLFRLGHFPLLFVCSPGRVVTGPQMFVVFHDQSGSNLVSQVTVDEKDAPGKFGQMIPDPNAHLPRLRYIEIPGNVFYGCV